MSRIRGHAGAPLLFFLLSRRFATSLTFVFRSFSSASRITREFSGPSSAFPQTSTHSPATSSPCSSTRAPSALERKISLSVDGDSGSGSQASILRQQGNFAEDHAAVALVAATKKKRSASTQMSKSENPRFVFFLFPHSKRVAAAFSLPRARCLPSSLC